MFSRVFDIGSGPWKVETNDWANAYLECGCGHKFGIVWRIHTIDKVSCSKCGKTLHFGWVLLDNPIEDEIAERVN